MAVVWAVVIAGGMGLLLGMWLRVPAVFAASAATVIACIALTPRWSLLAVTALSFGSLTALQIGYLVGVMLSCARSRAGSGSGLLRWVPRNR